MRLMSSKDLDYRLRIEGSFITVRTVQDNYRLTVNKEMFSVTVTSSSSSFNGCDSHGKEILWKDKIQWPLFLVSFLWPLNISL